ncbi:MAG TPA: DUF4342 domain-containing protein [Clostridia bacterium]|nr:DUF4342 domain-containing protein [Clostridia bacterium]
MKDELAKIDLIRTRLGISYKRAKEALDQADGDVVQALIMLEDDKQEWDELLEDKGEEFLGNLKATLSKGHETRVKIKKGDRTLLTVPASLSVLGLLGVLFSRELAVLSALGTATAMAKNYSIEIDRQDEDSDSAVFGE